MTNTPICICTNLRQNLRHPVSTPLTDSLPMELHNVITKSSELIVDGIARTNLPRKLRGKPFQPGHDPRRNVTKGGRPSDDFTATMRALASDEDTIAELRKILKDRNHEHFIKALTFCADRGYGKPVQPVDVISDGKSLADVLREGRDRVARMRDMLDPERVQ